MANQHSTPSRRAVIAASAALAAGTAVNLAAIVAKAEGDAELRALWAEYQSQVPIVESTYANYKRARDPFEVEMPRADEIPDWDERTAEWNRLWTKHGLEPLNDAWNRASDRLTATVGRIQAAKATTLFGIAVKLVALPLSNFSPDDCDYDDAVRSTVSDLDTLLGTTEFSAAYVAVAGERFEGIDDDEDEA